MPGRLAFGRTLFLAALISSMPSESIAQRYGHGGRWHGGYAGAHYGYGGYGYRGYGYRGYGYRPYYGYRAYHPYYGYPAWGFLGAMLGAVLVPRPVYYYPVLPSPPPPAPAYQQCPDGSTVPVGSHCVVIQSAPAPAPAPAPPPVMAPQPAPERG